MDELQQRALVRGLITFLCVAIAGSLLVWGLGHGGGTTGAPTPTGAGKSPSPSVGEPAPLAWLAWVPGGLPTSFGDLIATVPDVVSTSTVTADIAWMTASFDENGDGVDQPETPMMIPIDTTGVGPTFAAFLPEPERQLVENLRTGEGVLSESEAQLRGLGEGSTLVFDGGEEVSIVGTLPDALMGGYELLVTRDTGRRIGVDHERYVLFHVGPTSSVTSDELITEFRALLPADTPYPAIEVRAPGEAAYLRANDRAAPPLLLKQKFGEFEAHPDTLDPTQLVIDPTWVQDNIRSETLPVFGTVSCHAKTLYLLRRAANAMVDKGEADAVTDVGPCFDPTMSVDGPAAPLTAAAWGAAIELNPSDNLPGDRPDQSPDLVREMYRWGFAWGGNDAYPQGAFFPYRRTPVPQD
jgi:hypothetical protein